MNNNAGGIILSLLFITIGILISPVLLVVLVWKKVSGSSNEPDNSEPESSLDKYIWGK